jgi:hypothetical protein
MAGNPFKYKIVFSQLTRMNLEPSAQFDVDVMS